MFKHPMKLCFRVWLCEPISSCWSVVGFDHGQSESSTEVVQVWTGGDGAETGRRCQTSQTGRSLLLWTEGVLCVLCVVLPSSGILQSLRCRVKPVWCEPGVNGPLHRGEKSISSDSSVSLVPADGVNKQDSHISLWNTPADRWHTVSHVLCSALLNFTSN